jgi:hypothetical protein
MLWVTGGPHRREGRVRSRLVALGGTSVIALGLAAIAACAVGVQPSEPPPEGPGGWTPPSTAPDSPATTRWGTPPTPGQLVAVGTDGVLAVVQTFGGERVRELARSGRPGPGQRVIGDVTRSAGTAWFDTRNRSGGAGRIYQVPTDGSAPPTQVATGTSPEVDPSGGRLAFVSDGAVVVHGVITDDEERFPTTGRVTDLMWTTDGNDLLWVRNGTELVWLDRDGGGEPQVLATAGPGETLRRPLGQLQPYGTVNVAVGTGPRDQTPERLSVRLDAPDPSRDPDTLGWPLDRSYDASAEWGLRVTASHTVRWSGSGGVGTIASGYRAADF